MKAVLRSSFTRARAPGLRGVVWLAGALLATCAVAQSNYPAPYVIVTLAGTAGLSGSADGAGESALFNNPTGVAVDGEGNVFVADSGNSTIREITPSGAVTTLAGAPTIVGSADGVGGDARFSQAYGVAVDAAGAIYVADNGNDTIRKITPTQAGGGTTWTVATLAGSAGLGGTADGTGAAARFNRPAGVAVDASGNVYVADDGNNTIRKVTATGVVTTLAGTAGALAGSADGTGAAARFDFPSSIAVDISGNLYIGDSGNFTIRKISPTQVNGVTTWAVTTLAGLAGQVGSADGTGAAARFDYPAGVVADGSGNVYVADDGNNTIRRITAAGVVTTLAGAPSLFGGSADGTGASAQFQYPFGVALDSTGALYVGDSSNDTIRKGLPSGEVQIATQPLSQTVNAGSTVVFTIAIVGAGGTAVLPPGDTCEWLFNGVVLTDGGAISGATGPQLQISGANLADAGNYDCLVTSGGTGTLADSAALVVTSTPNPGFLVNLSARAYVGTGPNLLIGGFYIGGGASRTVLIQALGPALSGLGVSGALRLPALTIHDSTGATIYSNAGWGHGDLLKSAAAAAYANPVLQPDSGDSEVLVTLPPGGYTAEVTGADGGTGVALCAIYQLP